MRHLNKMIALMLMLAQAYIANAQQSSILDGNPVWIYEQRTAWTSSSFGYNLIFNVYHVYYTKGDTLINDTQYKKVYHDRMMNPREIDVQNPVGIKGQLVAAVREADGRLLASRQLYTELWGDADWYYEAERSTADELVVYDFNAMTPDGTLTVRRGEATEQWNIAQGRGTTMLDGTMQPSYVLTDESAATREFAVGIGVVQGTASWFAPFADDAHLLPDSLVQSSTDGPSTYSDTDETHNARQKATAMIFKPGNDHTSRLLMMIRDNQLVYNPDKVHNFPYLADYMTIDLSCGDDGFVDLGLTVKWAACNLGADTPAGRGLYYLWGDTVGIDLDHLDAYSSTYDSYKDKLLDSIGGTIFDAAYRQNPLSRMPTVSEFEELWTKCEWFELIIDGQWGHLIKGYNGNTLFLPECSSINRYGTNSNGLQYNKSLYDSYYMTQNRRYAVNFLENLMYTKWTDAAGQIRPVYDDPAGKWLSTDEYLRYNSHIWGTGAVVNPTVTAWEELLATYPWYLIHSTDAMDRLQNILLTNFSKYVEAKGIQYFADHADRQYRGSDLKVIYFLDHIDDGFIEFMKDQAIHPTWPQTINRDENDMGTHIYTKTCTIDTIQTDPALGLPDNQYIYAEPTTRSSQPYIAFVMPQTLLTGCNHTLRITMAPETHDDVTPMPNKFRVNLFFRNKAGSWPTNRDITLTAPGTTERDFITSATEPTVFDIPLDIAEVNDFMVQLQSYVSSADTRNYSRSLRIAAVEVISTPVDADYLSLDDMAQVGEETLSGVCRLDGGMKLQLDLAHITPLFGADADGNDLEMYAMLSAATSTLTSTDSGDQIQRFTLDMECVVNRRHTVNTDLFNIQYTPADGTLSITADDATCHAGVTSFGSVFLVDKVRKQYYELVLDLAFVQTQTELTAFNIVQTERVNVELMTTDSYYTHYDSATKRYSLVTTDIDLDAVSELLGTTSPMLYAEQHTDGEPLLTCNYTAAPAQGFWFIADDDGTAGVSEFTNQCYVGMYFIDSQLRWYEIPRRPHPGDTYNLNLYLTNPLAGSAIKYEVSIAYTDRTSHSAPLHTVRRLPMGMNADDTTAIEQIGGQTGGTMSERSSLTTPAGADGRLFNLQGQRISTPVRGLNIVNGKKVLVR